MVSGTHLRRLLGGVSRTERPVYAALARGLRERILDGRLPLRVRLPAERDLARALEVSRTTVTAAYDRLRDEGYLDSRRGAGSWTTLPAKRPRRDACGFWPGPGPSPDAVDFGIAALPAPPELPAAVAEAGVELARYSADHGYHLAGIPPLREAIAARYTERGLPTRADQIMVTSGALHSLDLLIQLSLGPGDAIVTESPTFHNALGAMRRRGLHIVPAGSADGGSGVELIEAGMRQTAARMCYVIADFHNPTGLLMPAEHRRELVDAVRRTGGYALVDEAYADMPVDPDLDVADLPPPVAAYDRGDHVISIGSAGKLYWGGLRVGWIRGTPPLVTRLAGIRACQDLAGPVLEQLVTVELMRHAARIRATRHAELRERRDALVAALGRRLPELRFRMPQGGMSLWGELDAPVGPELVGAAERHGVLLTPGPNFGADGTLDRFVRIPFCQPVPELVDGVERVARAYRELTPDRPAHLPALSV